MYVYLIIYDRDTHQNDINSLREYSGGEIGLTIHRAKNRVRFGEGFHTSLPARVNLSAEMLHLKHTFGCGHSKISSYIFLGESIYLG